MSMSDVGYRRHQGRCRCPPMIYSICIYMYTYIYIYAAVSTENGSQGDFPYSVYLLLIVQTEVCRLSDKVTNRSFPFSNGLNGLAHLCLYLYVRSEGKRESKNQGAQILSPKKAAGGSHAQVQMLNERANSRGGQSYFKK